MTGFSTFHEVDTTLLLWLKHADDPLMQCYQRRVLAHLRKRGFRVQHDREIKRRYPALGPDHHEGRKGALEVKVERSGRCLELSFFQNVVFENPHGGRYDFARLAKMPYLVRKRYELERDLLAQALADIAPFVKDTKLSGAALIQARRESLNTFQRRDMYASPPEPYNACGAMIADGDTVYFRHNGRLLRGVAFHNINNMWWVLLPCCRVRNIASFNLMHRTDVAEDALCSTGRWFDAGTRERRMRERRLRRRLDAAVAGGSAEQTEQAARSRGSLRAAGGEQIAATGVLLEA